MSSFKMEVDCDQVDNATLRLECASSLLTMIHIQLSGNCDTPSSVILCNALFGINLLVEDAQKSLAA